MRSYHHNCNLVDVVRNNEVYLSWKSPRDERVLEVMSQVDRADFVVGYPPEKVYEDRPVAIGYGATCSQPSMVAFMADVLELQPGQHVLGIGTGCGYADAIAYKLISPGGRLTSIEVQPRLAMNAEKNLRDYFGSNMGLELVVGNGCRGFAPSALYDRIYVAAALPLGASPLPFLQQLAEGGILICPERVGEDYVAEVFGDSDLALYRKTEGIVTRMIFGKVGFVPLRSEAA